MCAIKASRLIGIILLLMSACGIAEAQTVYGPEGLFLHPTPLIPAVGQQFIQVSLLPEHYPHALIGAPSAPLPGLPPAVPMRPRTGYWLYGSYDRGFSPRLEGGATIAWVNNYDQRHDTAPSAGLFAKCLIVKQQGYTPGVAIGATGIFFGTDRTTMAYAVAREQVSNSYNFPLTVDAGYQYEGYLNGVSRQMGRPYGAIEFGVTPGWALQFEAEPRLGGDLAQPLAVSLVDRSDSGYRFALGWANNGTSDRPLFAITFGKDLYPKPQ